MKKVKKPKSFSFLLARTYLLLTIELIICIVLVQLFASYQLNKVMPQLRIGELFTQVSATPQRVLSERELSRFLGENAYLQVYNAQGELISSSGASEEAPLLSRDEMLSLPTYSDGSFHEMIPYKDDAGSQRYLLTHFLSTGNGREENEFYILDENYTVISSSGRLEKESFTQREFELFSGTYPPGQALYRENIMGDDGSAMTMIFSVAQVPEHEYLRAINFWQNSWLLIAIPYAFFVTITIIWLNRKMRRLLRPLEESIGSILSNEPSEPIPYVGPREFVEIYSRFNTLAERLSYSEAQRQKLDTAKDTLMANISHDLKTPITVIQGYAKAIHDGVIPPSEQPRYLETIYRKSIRLTELINAFFEYSKLRHPSIPLAVETEDLTEYLTQYLAEKHQEIELAGFLLEVELPEQKVHCGIDRSLLRRALDNLLANAQQYNPLGTTIYFDLEAQTEVAVIHIGDDGVGITGAMDKDFFEPFVIGDEARSDQSGTGLGLAITASIIDRHQGSIRLLEPQAPWKTLFRIEIPRDAKSAS